MMWDIDQLKPLKNLEAFKEPQDLKASIDLYPTKNKEFEKSRIEFVHLNSIIIASEI